MSKYNIDFKNLPSSPIEYFYNHVTRNIAAIASEFLNKKFKNSKADIEKIDVLKKEVDDIYSLINERKKRDKIKSRKIANGFMIFFFILIIGLVFLPIFIKNRDIIDKFKKFENENLSIINEKITEKNREIRKLFSTFSTKDFIYHCFNELGIKSIDYINTARLSESYDMSDVLDVYSGFYGIFKNSPFFDVLLRKLVFEGVVTSQSESFPYTEVVRDVDSDGHVHYHNVTRWETLIAYHTEDTPFIRKTHHVVLETNFLPELTFNYYKDEVIKKKKKILKKNKKTFVELENNEFNKISKFDWDEQHEHLISQFATIKFQEDFVEWNKNYAVYNFQKYGNKFNVYDDKIEDNPKLLYAFENLDKTFDDLDILNNKDNLSLETITDKVTDIALMYFVNWSMMMQVPLLVPGISREWYRGSGRYLIANSSDLEIEAIDKIEKIQPIELTTKFLNPKFSSIRCGQPLARPLWFTEESTTQDKNINISYLKANSYTSRTLYDPVPVYGVHVGSQVIYVPYTKFDEVDEKKLLIWTFKYFKTTNEIIISPTMKLNIEHMEEYYQDNDLYKTTQQFNIWTNNVSNFEKSTKKEKIIELAKFIFELESEYNLDIAIKIDEYGICCYVDNLTNVNDEIINSINTKIKWFSNYNYWKESISK